LKELIKKYSEFINFPIKLKTIKEMNRTVPDEDNDEAAAEEPADAPKDGETAPKPKKTKIVKEMVTDYALMNDNKAIWTKAKEDITDEDYTKFYKTFSKDYDEPMSWIHFKAEGEVDFTGLLYIAKKAPHDLFDNY